MFDANTYRDEAASVRAAHNADIKAISESTELTVEAKQRHIAERHAANEKRLNEIRNREDTAREDRISELRLRLVKRRPTDSSDDISWRDAADRAERLETEPQAISVLRQAIDNIDKPLMRSVLRAGYDNGWADVINTYTAANRGDYEDAEELWSLTRPRTTSSHDVAQQLFKDMMYSAL